MEVYITWQSVPVRLHVSVLLLCKIYNVGLVMLPCKFKEISHVKCHLLNVSHVKYVNTIACLIH